MTTDGDCPKCDDELIALTEQQAAQDDPWPESVGYGAGEADPTAGERVCGLCRRYGHDDADCPSNPENWPPIPATPDAGDASTSASEPLSEDDREALLHWLWENHSGATTHASLVAEVERIVAAREAKARAEVGEPLTDDERQTLNERLHRDGFYAPAVRARILDALDDTLAARIVRDVTRPATAGPVDWDSPTWGGGTHEAAWAPDGTHDDNTEED